MNNKSAAVNADVAKAVKTGRERTNILKESEHKLLVYFVQRIPGWINSDMLTLLGLFGNVLVCLSFLLGAYVNKAFLLLNILGFMVSWFGDSLDGRLAFYRNKPRKWYGFSLDLTVDWIGIILVGLGFMFYVGHPYTFIGYAFIVMYGWEMITAILRYKVTGQYSIDSGKMGPTEVRIIISSIIILEYFFNGSIIISGALIGVVLLIANISDFIKLLKMADQRDLEEKQQKDKI